MKHSQVFRTFGVIVLMALVLGPLSYLFATRTSVELIHARSAWSTPWDRFEMINHTGNDWQQTKILGPFVVTSYLSPQEAERLIAQDRAARAAAKRSGAYSRVGRM